MMMPGAEVPKRSFFSKVGEASLGFWAGIGGIIIMAYPVALTASDAAIGARRGYHSSRSVPLKLIKGAWGFIRGAVKGFFRGIIKGIAAPFVLPYLGWKGKLSDKLRNEKDKVIADVRGHGQSPLVPFDDYDLPKRNTANQNNDQQEFNRAPPPDDDLEAPDVHEEDLPPIKIPPKVLPQYSQATQEGARPTITLTAHVSLTPKELNDIEKRTKKFGSFSVNVNDGVTTFTGTDPIAAFKTCKNFALQNAKYHLTLPEENQAKGIKQARHLIEKVGLKITKCTIGAQTYDVIGGILYKQDKPDPTKPPHPPPTA